MGVVSTLGFVSLFNIRMTDSPVMAAGLITFAPLSWKWVDLFNGSQKCDGALIWKITTLQASYDDNVVCFVLLVDPLALFRSGACVFWLFQNQVTFIYIELYTIQIASEQLYRNKQCNNNDSVVQTKFNL